MRTSSKIAVAAAFVGLAVAGGAAFTGAGLSSTAPASQFIGGTVSQTVTGATLTSVAYQFTDTSNTAIDQATLTFAPGAGGKAVAIVFAGSGATAFTCAPIDAGTNTSVCDATSDPATGVTGASITVS
ncbi:hypothetical protein [Nakamurella endophytica]|uniref:Uncharacterized protein n=1 Tax=Nakamurella endophytica TaxID=1748367 RepID=A0A917WFT6_9ACTN|nr:hypothetical protein [Nakamurella endophytica]GGL99153.1 hypothetical protein GCM10011594_18930 [Nakamurella endophytica]